VLNDPDVEVKYRFDNFDKKAIKVLNQVLEETGAEIVVSPIGDYMLI
jgi:predicted nucleotide-binding protein (sugar kinase/HSP70/actin superfamily)